jgi:signal transduction histidine kinase
MDALIEDLLSYSRVSRIELDPEPLDLEDVVRDVLVHLPDLDERADIEVARDGMPRVLGHRAALFQALTNLVSNALKFVPPGTRPSVRIHAERRERRVRLWVEDNGIGIAPEHHERIFRVFERLHGRERYPGTGVGLAIVRKAIERMGGASGVESRVGAGSRFWIELPAGPAAVTTPDDGPADRARRAAHLQGS